MIKVGVIGYGYSARTFHLPLIETLESFSLTAISSSQVEVVQAEFPAVEIFNSARDLIAKSDVDLVVITAPNDVHYSIAMACIEHKIHVVIEKPMVTTSADAEKLVNVAKKESLLLSVFHNRRWDGDFLTVKKMLENGSIGDIRLFESHFDRFRPLVRERWRENPGAGSGIWFDLGSHLVDQAICLFGMPDSITARCLPLRENSKTTDFFHVLLHFKGFEVILRASSFSAGPNRRFNVEGTKGSFTKYGLDPQEGQLKNGLTPSDQEYGKDNIELFGTLFTESNKTRIETEAGSYQKYYIAVADAINFGKGCPVSGEDAIEVMKILELAEQSSRDGLTISIEKN